MRRIICFRELKNFLLILGVALCVTLTSSLHAIGKDTKKTDFSGYVGLWKVKEKGGLFLGTKTQLWILREKKGRLIIEIPHRKIIFDEVNLEDVTLTASYNTRDGDDNDRTTAVEIEIVEGLFDGEYEGRFGRANVTGRLYPLYKKAKNAE